MSTDNNQITDFDASEYLDNEELIQGYINEAVKTHDAGFIADSLGIIAKARGMTNLAKTTGLSRESLYNTLSKKGNPNLKTLLAVATALNVSLNLNKKDIIDYKV